MSINQENCMTMVSDGTAWSHTYQCSRKRKVEVAPDIWLCTQHAKEAQTRGWIAVMTGATDRWNSHPITQRIDIAQDESLVAVQKAKDDTAEAWWREKTGIAAAECAQRLAQAVDAVFAVYSTGTSVEFGAAMAELRAAREAMKNRGK